MSAHPLSPESPTPAEWLQAARLLSLSASDPGASALVDALIPQCEALLSRPASQRIPLLYRFDLAESVVHRIHGMAPSSQARALAEAVLDRALQKVRSQARWNRELGVSSSPQDA
jgi:HPt (histidine-containing phosphotransfer) domain-containing protein